jgi:hypothetical protein
MAAINAFRKLIVYPALLRSVAAQWNATFGAGKRKLARRASQPAKIQIVSALPRCL